MGWKATVRVPRRSLQMRSAICCAIVPLGMNTAASAPRISAMRASSRSIRSPEP